MKRFIPLILATAALSGCATPETRLRSGLVSAGLGQRVSSCMAAKMVDRLSLLQLRRLASLGSLDGQRLTDLSMSDFLYKVRALRDPEILTITTKAGLSCAIDS
jgi:Prokaryotic membrane lipoprotein lipid attachment site